MSIDCRILRRVTDGKTQYYYRNSGVKPTVVKLFDKLEDIPEPIRCHFDKKEPQDTGPDFAHFLGVQNILYPNFLNCTHPDYFGKRCIAEMCKYASDGNWEKCPYFIKP